MTEGDEPTKEHRFCACCLTAWRESTESGGSGRCAICGWRWREMPKALKEEIEAFSDALDYVDSIPAAEKKEIMENAPPNTADRAFLGHIGTLLPYLEQARMRKRDDTRGR